MKFARYDGGRTALVVGPTTDQVLDVAAHLHLLPADRRDRVSRALPGDGSGSWSTIIADWPELRPIFRQLESLATAGAAVTLKPIATVRLDAPLPSRARKIFALGANTVAHMVAASARLANTSITPDDIYKPKLAGAPPFGFSVFPDSVVGPDAQITPPHFVRKLDYEGECAAILGVRGRDLGPAPTVWGYTAWNDLGMRDGHLGLLPMMPAIGYSFNLWKNWDGANACGPWVVVDESASVADLRCEVYVNGDRRQDWNTGEMIYSFAETFDHLSRYLTLEPGDMVVSGTGAGTAMEGPFDGSQWLKPGDVVDIRLDGVGPLRTTIGDW